MGDLKHNWCGIGCGADLCVQPGTSNASLTTYLGTFNKGMDWLHNHTVNDYSVCPECYRQNTTMPSQKQRVHIQRAQRQVCKICTQGMCSKCQECKDSKDSTDSQCAGCWRGGCLPSCQNCWNDILV